MATPTSPGDGRDQVSGTIAGQAFNITSANILPILLLIVAGIAGYLVYQAVDSQLLTIRNNIIKLYEFMKIQEDLIQDASHALKDTLKDQTRDVKHIAEEQSREMLRILSIMEYNRDRPLVDRIPLVIDPPPKH